jgi:hypothetical protein
MLSVGKMRSGHRKTFILIKIKTRLFSDADMAAKVDLLLTTITCVVVCRSIRHWRIRSELSIECQLQ